MTGIKVIGLLFYSFLIQFSRSIDLILPLSDEDAPNFKIESKFLTEPQPDGGHLYKLITYESLTNDIIRRVLYYGVELINDKEEHPPDFMRYVIYRTTDDRVLLEIVKKESGMTTIEQTFGVCRDVISAFAQIPEVPEGIIRNNDRSTTGIFLSSIFVKNQNSNRTDYGDLDSVDDQPYLVRGNKDISVEEIEKEKDKIMEKNSSTTDDPEVAGTSGLSKFSNLRIETKNDKTGPEESDSD